MERLVHLVSARQPRTLYVLWSERNRISIIKQFKNQNKTWFKFMHCDWFLVYKLKEESRSSINTTVIEKAGKYVIYDGNNLQEFHDSDYKLSNGILKRLATAFASSPLISRKQSADHLDLLSMTQEMKYLKSIVGNMNDCNYMKSWLDNDQERYKMMYTTLVFLACMAINPSFTLKNSPFENTEISVPKRNGFTVKTKQRIITSWQKTHETIQDTLWIDGKARQVELIRDCCGLWVVGHSIKKDLGNMAFLDEKEIVSAFDIEHIVSNSYDIPTKSVNDWSDGWNQDWNGVLLDSSVNRKKGNTMLYLIGDELVATIRRKRDMQQVWLRRNRVKWYQNLWTSS